MPAFKMVHNNLNVLDLEKSLDFYYKAFGLKTVRRVEDDGFTLCFLANENGEHQIELTWLHDRTEPYDLGDNEIHIGFWTDDIEAAHKLHEEMGIICFENPHMGIYFVKDPDGYWLEVTTTK